MSSNVQIMRTKTNLNIYRIVKRLVEFQQFYYHLMAQKHKIKSSLSFPKHSELFYVLDVWRVERERTP